MKSSKVLIVDDNVDFVEMMSLVISGWGCDVFVVYSGEDAIKECRQEDFDIVFMDVKLPGKNGVEAFLEIKRQKPKMKVVMMVGYYVYELMEQASSNGIWGIMDKPLDMKEVSRVIYNALNSEITPTFSKP